MCWCVQKWGWSKVGKLDYAASCYYEHDFNAKRAGREFAKKLKERYADRHSKFVKAGYERLEAQKEGRQRKISATRKITDKDAKQCARIISEGYRVGRERRFYTSIKHAIRDNEFIRSVIEKTCCSPKTLYRAVKREMPTLAYRPIVLKRSLTPDQKAARLEGAKELRRLIRGLVRLLLRTIWVDAKSFETVTQRLKGWINLDDQGLAFCDKRVHRNKSQRQYMRLYAAVSPLAGPIALIFTTGTYGGGDSGPFLVRLNRKPPHGQNPENPRLLSMENYSCTSLHPHTGGVLKPGDHHTKLQPGLLSHTSFAS